MPKGTLAELIIAGSAGAVSTLKTVQAFAADEFVAAQKRAGAIVGNFKPPS